jgi:hypothetical protein
MEVVGTVGVAGSPSCGVTSTLDLDASLVAIAACPHRPVSPGWLERRVVGPAVRPGRGLFVEAVRAELSAHRQDVPMTEFALRRIDVAG